MSRSAREVIAELKRNRRFQGTCPVCQQDFRLADAALFALDDQPPEVALLAIADARQRIQDRSRELAMMREKMTVRAQEDRASGQSGKDH